MLEIVLVLSALLTVGLLAAATTALSAEAITQLGLSALLLGVMIGLPTGLWYQMTLYRLRAKKRPIPQRWWLSPSNDHAQLAREEITRIRRWSLLGVLGLFITLAGGLAAMAGLLLSQP